MEKNKKVTLLKDFFGSRGDISLAFLFGSSVSGRARNDSDVDIAVYFSKEYKNEDVEVLWNELEALLKSEVDLGIYLWRAWAVL